MNQINPIMQAMQQRGVAPQRMPQGMPQGLQGLSPEMLQQIMQLMQQRGAAPQGMMPQGMSQRPQGMPQQRGMNPIMQAMQQQPGSSFGSRSSRPPVPMPQPAAPTPGYGSVPKSRFGGGFGR